MAEDGLGARCEKTATMGSEANTVRSLERKPTLAPLRECEVLEKVAANGRLSVVLGEGGFADRVITLL